MKNIKFKLSIILLFICVIILNAQKTEQNYTREITVKKRREVTLNVNFADIEIREWKEKKIKVNAVLTVEDISQAEAQKIFNSWEIGVNQNGKNVEIYSKTKNHFPDFLNYNDLIEVDFENFDFEMPEISFESLGVLDSMNFSFPEINFKEVFSDSTFNKVFNYDFNFIMDSITTAYNNIDFDKITKNQKYLQQWQKANKDNLIKLGDKAKELALKNKEIHKKNLKKYRENTEKYQLKKQELLKKIKVKIADRIEKKIELQAKLNKRRNKIKDILKDRNEAKVRTKLIIHVPKGTQFNMNVNYSKISTN